MKGFKIAVVGATGAVGREMFRVLEQRNFPVSELVPFASGRSEGKKLRWGGQEWACQSLKRGADYFKGVQIAFFDASDAVSKEWVPEAARAGAWVVDNSAAFRMETDIPLLVPEVNGFLVENLLSRSKTTERERILAGPNCSTVQLVLPLKIIHGRWRLKRVVVSSYQSVSGAGTAAMEELEDQTRAALGKGRVVPKAFAHQIAFNCIPHIGAFKDGGYTSEENKIMEESRKILGLPDLKITATAVRVPTLSCHGESVNIECEKKLTVEDVRAALKSQPGISVQDEPKQGIYPMGVVSPGAPVEAASGRDAVYVGRIRQDFSVDNGLNLWIVSDNLRKGAALNAVQIGEILAKRLL